jgi:hypothetical protein
VRLRFRGHERAVPVLKAVLLLVEAGHLDATVTDLVLALAVPPAGCTDETTLLSADSHADDVMHVLAGDRYYLSWFVAVAEPVDPHLVERLGIAADEVFVHVDLSEQTLVVYRGTTPIFATLVSTGVEGHETPTGFFRVQRKMISDTMANLGPDAGDDAYRIEDVPWTQYFEGSLALHGAFWHDGFGLARSHGCINLSPQDAHRLFELTRPALPAGWHGVETSRDLPGSRVLITP